MSEDDTFLARWSRRKRQAAAQPRRPETPSSSPAEVAQPVPPIVVEATPAAIELPPIDSIQSGSDIKAFLAPGVPSELTRAALRRAWTVDPAIRDFVGLSENAWDFNAPDGVPGFGLLDLADVRRLLEGIFDEPRPSSLMKVPTAAAEDPAGPVGDAGPGPARSPSESPASIAALQYKKDDGETRDFEPRRRHGSALPQY
jgi:hypothetical protein